MKSRGHPVRVVNVVIVAVAVRVHIAEVATVVVIRRAKPPHVAQPQTTKRARQIYRA